MFNSYLPANRSIEHNINPGADPGTYDGWVQTLLTMVAKVFAITGADGNISSKNCPKWSGSHLRFCKVFQQNPDWCDMTLFTEVSQGNFSVCPSFLRRGLRGVLRVFVLYLRILI